MAQGDQVTALPDSRPMSLSRVLEISDARVSKMSYSGSYDILLTKLGRELIDDCNALMEVRRVLRPWPASMKTALGTQILNGFLEGVDDFVNLPSASQWQLREISKAQNFQGYSVTPSWANGAVIICTPQDASEIQQTLQGTELKKGDVVVSKEMEQFVRSVIEDRSEDPGPKRDYRKQRPKLKATPEDLHPPPVSFVTTSLLRLRAHSEPPQKTKLTDDSSRGTHSTGSRPRDVAAQKRDYGPGRKRFHLKREPCKQEHPDAHVAENDNDFTPQSDTEDRAEASEAEADVLSVTSTIAQGADVETWDFISNFKSQNQVPVKRSRDKLLCYMDTALNNLERHLLQPLLEITPLAKEMLALTTADKSAGKEKRQESLQAAHTSLSDKMRECLHESFLAHFVNVGKSTECFARAFAGHSARAFKVEIRKARIGARPLHLSDSILEIEAGLRSNVVAATMKSMRAGFADAAEEIFDQILDDEAVCPNEPVPSPGPQPTYYATTSRSSNRAAGRIVFLSGHRGQWYL